MTVCRSVGVTGRYFFSPMRPPLDLLEQLDLLIGLERDDRLLPVVAAPGPAALPLDLAPQLHGADVGHLDVEDPLDGALDLDLVGVARDLEEVLVQLLAQHGALLGDQHLADDRTGVADHFANTSWTRARPSRVSSSAWQSSRS